MKGHNSDGTVLVIHNQLQSMNALDAAAHVLSEVGQPLHYKEISRRILAQGLWVSAGKTPAATVNSRIAVDIKELGTGSRFIRTGPGLYALNNEKSTLADEPQETVTAPAADAADTLSFTDAAERVLEQHGQRKPLHYREITLLALDDGLLVTQGKTPEATMYAQILTEIQRYTRRGERPRFTKLGQGMVALSRWGGEGLAFQIERHNREVRRKLLDTLKTMPPVEFEAVVGRLLTAMGFEQVVMTPVTGDGGIDVRGVMVIGDAVRIKMAVQVKRWKNNVQSKVVREVRGGLGAHEQGLIVTTSGFSSGAVSEATRQDATPVGLMDGDQLVNLLVENDIGVHRTSHDIIELGDTDAE